jgi:hypothetical protein
LAGTLFVRRNVFWAIGGYDERLKYSENSDLTWRLGDYCLASGLTVLRDEEPRIRIRQSENERERLRSYGSARVDAARHLLSTHRERFLHDPIGRADYWRIVAHDEFARGRVGRAGFALIRSALAAGNSRRG